ncbi:MAG TPA: hypothetical protein VMZ00_01075 [Sporichthya sp.]|nr:hypothetical protein [Sporichthya sp.]
MTPNPNLPTTSAVAVRPPHLTIPGLAVDDLWLAPDGAVIAVLTGVDSAGASSLLFLDSTTGAERGAIALGADDVPVLAGDWTAVACYDRRTGEISVRRAVTGEVTARLSPHPEGRLHALAIAHRKDLAASIGADGAVAIWRPGDGAVEAVFTPVSMDLEFCALTFSPHGRVLAVRTAADTLELWTTAPPRLFDSLPETGPPVFSADGRWLAVAGAAITLYDLRDATGAGTVLPGQNPLAFTPDGARLVAAAPDGSTAIWQTDPPQPFAHLRGSNARLSPDGRVLALVGTTSELVVAEPTGRTLARLTGVRGEVEALTVGTGGAVVVAACSDAAIRVWRSATP